MRKGFLILLFLGGKVFAQIDKPICKAIDEIAEAEKNSFQRSLSVNRSQASSNFQVTYYRCVWVIDPAVRYIKGVVTSHFLATSSSNTISYDLASQLDVDSVYFHGNKRNISWYSRFASQFTNNGYEVLMIDYPGFGKSSGKFTEKLLYEWSRQLYKFARSTYTADSIIIYGKSMGTGLASYLASREQCRRLILETPYYDMPSVISHYLPVYPVGRMLHYQLPNYEYLQFVDEPVSIFHGTDDGVISYRNAKRLKKYLKSSDEFVTVADGKHNNLYSFPLVTQKLDSLLQM